MARKLHAAVDFKHIRKQKLRQLSAVVKTAFSEKSGAAELPHRTTMTLQYSDAGVSGVQLNTLARAKGPRITGNVKVSAASTKVSFGNTEISVETEALFEL